MIAFPLGVLYNLILLRLLGASLHAPSPFSIIIIIIVIIINLLYVT